MDNFVLRKLKNAHRMLSNSLVSPPSFGAFKDELTASAIAFIFEIRLKILLFAARFLSYQFHQPFNWLPLNFFDLVIGLKTLGDLHYFHCLLEKCKDFIFIQVIKYICYFVDLDLFNLWYFENMHNQTFPQIKQANLIVLTHKIFWAGNEKKIFAGKLRLFFLNVRKILKYLLPKSGSFHFQFLDENMKEILSHYANFARHQPNLIGPNHHFFENILVRTAKKLDAVFD